MMKSSETGFETPRDGYPISKKRLWGAALALAALSFVYMFAMGNGFVEWDDNLYVYDNTRIRTLDAAFLKWAATAPVAGNWHPLTMIALAIDYALWGLNPAGYIFTNILLHVANTLLVFFLLLRLSQAKNRQGTQPGATYSVAAAIAAMLFAIHPLHVESVSWISERKDVLYAFFYLLSLLLYIEYLTGRSAWNRRYYYLCLAAFILSLMSKPMAVTLPLVLLVLDFYPFRRLSGKNSMTGNLKIIAEKWPFFLMSLFTGVVTIWTQLSDGAVDRADIYPASVRLAVAVHSYVVYIVKSLFPFNLSPYYPHPVQADYLSFDYLGSFALVALITLCAFGTLKQSRLYFALWLYYLITLFPVIGVVKVGGQYAADRYSCLPGLALFFLVGLAAGKLFEKCARARRLTVTGLLATSIIILACLTVRQIDVWKDTISLTSRVIDLYPDIVDNAYHKRGEAYARANKYREALDDFPNALRINPKHVGALNSRGILFDRLGMEKRAIGDFERAIEEDPYYPKAYLNRGNVYYRMGDYDAAIRDYRKTAELAPDYPKTYSNLALACDRVGDAVEALRYREIAAKLEQNQ